MPIGDGAAIGFSVDRHCCGTRLPCSFNSKSERHEADDGTHAGSAKVPLSTWHMIQEKSAS